MTGICWWLVERLSRMLEADERDAVCGDFAESGETGGRALHDVFDLVVRRQATLWKNWRPWLALIGLVVPLGLLLSLRSRMLAFGSATPLWMYFNNWTWTYLTNSGARLDFIHNCQGIFTEYLTLSCWSWASGFVLGSFSRRTTLVCGALFCLVALFAVSLGTAPYLLPGQSHFDDGSHDPVFSLAFYSLILPLLIQMVVVVMPSVWGMKQGGRMTTGTPLLRTLLWASAFVTVTVLAIRNWGWVLCWSGRSQTCADWALQAGYARQPGSPEGRPIPILLLALVGPVGYMAATAIGLTKPSMEKTR
jgi:hypothetical protein